MQDNIKVTLIVAVDSKYGISKNNSIPWRIREDMLFFQDVTKRPYMNNRMNALIMGRNTFESLPNKKPLPDRINIIVSGTLVDPNLNIVTSLNDAISLATNLNVGRIFIAGGSRIYNDALELNLVDDIYLTKIDKDYECDNFINQQYIKKFMIYNNNEFHLTQDNIKVNFMKLFKHRWSLQWNINHTELSYQKLLKEIIQEGDHRNTRNGNTWSLFGKTFEFDLSKEFPLLTTKKVSLNNIFQELMFFIRGDTNTKHLSDINVNIWEPNTNRQYLDATNLSHYETYDMGPMYGFNWRHYGQEYEGMNTDYTNKGIDQLKECIDLIKNNPTSRRIIMTSFNPSNVKQGCLYPCHSLIIQFYIEKQNKLSMQMYQRSCDMAIGFPYNCASMALLNHMICEIVNNDVSYTGNKLTPGRLLHVLGDMHVYENHYGNIVRQYLREPFNFPKLITKRKVTDLLDFKFEDFELEYYIHYPFIKFEMNA